MTEVEQPYRCDVMENCGLPYRHPYMCSELVGTTPLIPREPFSEIADGLWQGNSYATPYCEQFDAVFTLYRSAPPVEPGIRHKHWNIPDSHMPPLEDLDSAVAWVSSHWKEGRRVLVRCQAGLNRSGLVVARVLIDSGATPSETIHLIRRRRSPYALCNSNFERYLRALGKESDV